VARPKKQTAEYFPHFVLSGKTIFILESSFGNDGYAFWFKLLEILGATEGHYYNCNNLAEWKFLLAKTRVDEEKALKILNTLSELGAIDQELWGQKILWVQKFVDNLAELYKKRASETPKKPSFHVGNPFYGIVSDVETPQRKGEESIVKESKEEESINPPTPPDFQQAEVKKIMDFYKKNFGVRAVPAQVHMLLSFLDDGTEADLVIEALSIAVKGQKFDLRYTEAILVNWVNNGIMTMQQYKEHEEKRNMQKKTKVQSQKDNSKGNSNSFNNFANRKYDGNALEELLLENNKIKRSVSDEDIEKIKAERRENLNAGGNLNV
jgi:DnaD/phage-associated family protein